MIEDHFKKHKSRIVCPFDTKKMQTNNDNIIRPIVPTFIDYNYGKEYKIILERNSYKIIE